MEYHVGDVLIWKQLPHAGPFVVVEMDGDHVSMVRDMSYGPHLSWNEVLPNNIRPGKMGHFWEREVFLSAVSRQRIVSTKPGFSGKVIKKGKGKGNG